MPTFTNRLELWSPDSGLRLVPPQQVVPIPTNDQRLRYGLLKALAVALVSQQMGGIATDF
jgi:hypothetical protein